MVKRWVSSLHLSPGGRGRPSEARAGEGARRPPLGTLRAATLPRRGRERSVARFSPSPIPTASPRTAAAEAARFLLANGRGGAVDPASALAREPFLAVAELAGSAAASRIMLAAPIALAEIEARFAGKIEEREAVSFDAASASLRARRSRRLGALVLAEQTKAVEPSTENAKLLAEGIATIGIGKLPWSKAQLQSRRPRAIPPQGGR